PSTTMKPIHLLRLRNFPIFKQLQIEESIYRSKNAGNWLIINQGTPEPIVVMGISGKPDRLVHLQKAADMNVPIMKRFTGGGTVIVDEHSLFTSFIMDNDWLAAQGIDTKAPRNIMKWSETFYRNVFRDHPDFSLMEHDYSFGHHKFGGNAQALSRSRFVHHTSFLFDFDDKRMAVLKQPEKTPEYRQGRDHLSFLCKLKDRYTDTETIATNIEDTMRSFHQIVLASTVGNKDIFIDDDVVTSRSRSSSTNDINSQLLGDNNNDTQNEQEQQNHHILRDASFINVTLQDAMRYFETGEHHQSNILFDPKELLAKQLELQQQQQ
ncbi:hypothetical protein SAMD00019534_027930, partial [Acytostelium subglobosum LB1]|uniref:hypothetical protein n=1 Tax=Acytostelium subglobosum LB1 TaxID=1410327 RepID=UPI0006449C75